MALNADVKQQVGDDKLVDNEQKSKQQKPQDRDNNGTLPICSGNQINYY